MPVAARNAGEGSIPLNLVCRIDMTAARRCRAKLSASGADVPYDAIFIFAVSRVVTEFPRFMGRPEPGNSARADSVTIAFLAALSDALYPLNVHEANAKSAAEIAVVVRRQMFRAARGKLADSDTKGACLTISNLGKYPVHAFAAVLPPGQAAILAIGAVEETPVVRAGEVTSAPLCNVTLTVDYRLINGRQAGRFLARLKETLEAL